MRALQGEADQEEVFAIKEYMLDSEGAMATYMREAAMLCKVRLVLEQRASSLSIELAPFLYPFYTVYPVYSLSIGLHREGMVPF